MFIWSLIQGNELVEAILDGPIVVIKDPRTEKNRVIDPGHIGKQLMMFRQQEAQVVMKVSEVPLMLVLLLLFFFYHRKIPRFFFLSYVSMILVVLLNDVILSSTC